MILNKTEQVEFNGEYHWNIGSQQIRFEGYIFDDTNIIYGLMLHFYCTPKFNIYIVLIRGHGQSSNRHHEKVVLKNPNPCALLAFTQITHFIL